MMSCPKTNVHGFSLVELSIVLVILGLLTGGILAGQSLIRASELRAVSTEYSRYKTAMGTFRDKYFALPGDMNNAATIWGLSGSCPGDSTTPSYSVTTCNGNADGTINNWNPYSEEFRFWQHLANAGLLEGSYTGFSNSATAYSEIATPGINIPKSRLNNAGWSMKWMGVITVADTGFFDSDYGNVFFFGAFNATWLNNNPVLKPEEAWNIDTKMDDGKPATGSILSFEWQGGVGTTSCSDQAASAAASLANSNYALANTGIYCSLLMKSGY